MPASDGLSAPEALVLLSLPRFDARKALKVGFMSLMAQGLVRMESSERRVMLHKLRFTHLHAVPDAPADLPPIAAALMRTVRAAEPQGSLQQVLAQARRQFGKSLAGFAAVYVVPALIARGLAESRQVRVLGLFPTTRYVRTAAGEAEKIRLENAMRGARDIPGFLDRDPAQAAALALSLGGAILLIEELHPYYRDLAAAMRLRESGGDLPLADGSSFDFGAVDLGAIDFSSVDFGGFDAGFSDAGGDGGGDGGGGDGGSSGC